MSDLIILAILAAFAIVLGVLAWRKKRTEGAVGGGLRSWTLAIIAMVIINGLLLLWLGPKGGFGLFLFLPFVFGGRRD